MHAYKSANETPWTIDQCIGGIANDDAVEVYAIQ